MNNLKEYISEKLHLTKEKDTSTQEISFEEFKRHLSDLGVYIKRDNKREHYTIYLEKYKYSEHIGDHSISLSFMGNQRYFKIFAISGPNMSKAYTKNEQKLHIAKKGKKTFDNDLYFLSIHNVQVLFEILNEAE